MIETPSPSNVRSDSKRRNGRSNRSAVRSDHVLEFDDAAVDESNGFVWVRHGWREVRIVKGIVKRIAKDGEAMSMMAAKYSEPGTLQILEDFALHRIEIKIHKSVLQRWARTRISKRSPSSRADGVMMVFGPI